MCWSWLLAPPLFRWLQLWRLGGQACMEGHPAACRRPPLSLTPIPPTPALPPPPPPLPSSQDIGRMPLGVKALATFPLKSAKRDKGLRDVPVSFAGVTVKPGDWVYADKDGVIVSPEELTL